MAKIPNYISLYITPEDSLDKESFRKAWEEAFHTDCGGEVVIPLKDTKTTFTVNIEPFGVESFRKAWEKSIRQEWGKMLVGIDTATTETPEIPKANIPHGKNLYSRKLRIRR